MIYVLYNYDYMNILFSDVKHRLMQKQSNYHFSASTCTYQSWFDSISIYSNSVNEKLLLVDDARQKEIKKSHGDLI
jgi:predicted acetyltransferase